MNVNMHVSVGQVLGCFTTYLANKENLPHVCPRERGRHNNVLVKILNYNVICLTLFVV